MLDIEDLKRLYQPRHPDWNDWAWNNAIHNAFPAILAKLEAAQKLYEAANRRSIHMPDDVLAALTACDFAGFDKEQQ